MAVFVIAVLVIAILAYCCFDLQSTPLANHANQQTITLLSRNFAHLLISRIALKIIEEIILRLYQQQLTKE